MKKRIIAAALISAVLTASLTSCSGSPKEQVSREETEEESSVYTKDTESAESVTSAATTNQTESTASEVSDPESTVTEPVQSETTPAESEVESDVESEIEEVEEQLDLDIEHGYVNNGSWYFTADNNGKTEHYLYNFADKKTVKFDVEAGYEVADITGYSVLLLDGANRVTHYEYPTVIRDTGKAD